MGSASPHISNKRVFNVKQLHSEILDIENNFKKELAIRD